MVEEYKKEIAKRKTYGIPPLPLTAKQTEGLLVFLLSLQTSCDDKALLLGWLSHNVPVGVDEAAKIKADFLYKIATYSVSSDVLSPEKAIELLGTMQGGYCVKFLIMLLETPFAELAFKQLQNMILIFENIEDVAALLKKENTFAKALLESWANATWFLERPSLPEKITLTVFKVEGETNTDDLSPAPDAFTRSDIPYHALSMLKNPRTGISPDKDGEIGPLSTIAKLKEKGHPLVYVGDVVGTGSSRKSATNSMLWHIGTDISYQPNKRTGGFCFGGKISPIFFDTQKDSGSLPIELDVSQMNMGDIITLYPYEGKVEKEGKIVALFSLKSSTMLDEFRAGGRLLFVIGRSLTNKARNILGLGESPLFPKPLLVKAKEGEGYTLAQKIVGAALNLPKDEGVLPGSYVEPYISTVGSQDTTGSMTRDEMKDLACLKFQADLVMQSFCHTAPYPKKSDIELHKSLPSFITSRGGVSLAVGDGVIHSWLNRLILPNTLGTGGDSHTRFPFGLSFPAGSGLVAFAAATGIMPLEMPESVLVRFSGKMNSHITLRDLVNAIPFYALKKGLLTLDKKGKKNIFSGRILEIEGLPDLKVEQAFELSDASAERSSAACSIALEEENVKEYLISNIALIDIMIQNGVQDSKTLQKRRDEMKHWLESPFLLKADKNAQYAAIIEIPLEEITEPLLACPNDPDLIKPLSLVSGTNIDEVFIGSCMTNIGHFRAAAKILEKEKNIPTKLWMAPPTKMDMEELRQEGLYGLFGRLGVRLEMPGCSLCMGNQAQVEEGATVVSTSTRNFPNRLGIGANVFLASAELASVCAKLGRIPTLEEYKQNMAEVSVHKEEIYRYLNFNKN